MRRTDQGIVPVRRSLMKLILSAEFLQAERMRSILENVMSAGGMWEQAFGGLLIIHAPQQIATAVLDEIKEMSARR